MKHYILLLFSLSIGISNAQVATNSELYKTLKVNDSLLFDRAFNFCESQYLESLISEDFEFYHDQSGITEGKEAFLKIMKEGICNPDNSTKSRRELIPGSLKVFPLYNNGKLYGGIQNGSHRFYEKVGDQPETKGSTADFTHLRSLKNNQWELIRVLSYNHH